MRTMLLSFKSDVYERVVSGEKIFEHRKVFPDETIKAYLYVSAPKKAITGIMILQNKKNIADWLEEYKDDAQAVKRINEYLEHHKVVMQIAEFQPTNEISLDKLREDNPGFVVPQMYYFLDGTQLEKYLEREIKPIGEKIKHDFSRIDSSQICVH